MSKLFFSLSIVFSLLLTGSVAFAATPEKGAPQQQNAKKSDFGVKAIDPFQKVEEKKQTTEKAPNRFLGTLQEKVVVPDPKKRPTKRSTTTKPAPQKASQTRKPQASEYNPFEDGEDDSMGFPSNPFEDSADDSSGFPSNPFEDEADFPSNPFEDGAALPSNPFAAGDPFAYEYTNKKGK